jgi:hypothetical protein
MALCDSNCKIGKDEDESVPSFFLVTTFSLGILGNHENERAWRPGQDSTLRPWD